jgi:6-phosphogluconolactonase
MDFIGLLFLLKPKIKTKMIHVFKTEHDLLIAFANFFIEKAQYFINNYGEFNVSLSGGDSPKKMYELLASPDFRGRLDWEKIYFFFGDERYVPANDKRNNALMAKHALFNPLKIQISHIFTIDTSLSPSESARKYMEVIAFHFKDQKVQFDLILLGLGNNAHTASLFPYSPVLSDLSAAVKSVYIEQQNSYRITMTAPLINQAHNIAFLVYGDSKAEAVKHVLKDAIDAERYPAQLICPQDGDLQWFLDEAAARNL